MRVRINFKRKLLNVYGNAQFIDDVNDEKYYQDFFSKVDKAIFLQKQKYDKKILTTFLLINFFCVSSNCAMAKK